MNAVLVLSLACLLAGSAILLDHLSWFRGRSLTARLGPHLGTSPRRWSGAGSEGGSWMAELATPLVHRVADRIGRAAGAVEPLPDRLRRAGWPPDADRFRLQQLRHAVLGLGAGGVAAGLVGTGAPGTAALLLTGTAVGSLWDERRLAAAVVDRRRRIQLELPVVAEQLAMLVAAGYSVPASLARLASRGHGAVASDLAGVGRRIRHGLGEIAALQEWADEVDVDAVRRLVAVLALHRDATDLAGLITHEARAARAEAHRELVESIERRGQLVWVPVTVATLVPGLLFLAVPFVAALSGVATG